MEAEFDDIGLRPQSKFINPYTDFGFKKLFGEEGSKDLLVDFLNQLLPPEYKILQLEFRDKEASPEIPEFRKAIFDLHCENERRDQFVIEMQKSRLEFFKDRVIFYMTFPIRNQATKGSALKVVKGEQKKVAWDFRLKPVYFIGILDFEFDDAGKDGEYVVEVEYKDQDNRPFYDKLKYFFVVMPRFNKTESELRTRKDKWIYFLKNLANFEEIPAILNEPIFQKGFDLARIANYDKLQLRDYERSYNDYLSFKASMDYQFNQGMEVGIEKGVEIGIEKGVEIGVDEGMDKKARITARKLIKKGMENEEVAEITELPLSEIVKIRNEMEENGELGAQPGH